MPKFIADFHIRSKYSRAVSPDMNLEELNLWAAKKGISVIGTGDFTHPDWFSELKAKLEPATEGGLFILKDINAKTRFIITVEVSSIYSKNGKVRKIHSLIFAPSLAVAGEINKQLGWRGNLRSDGRPILGLDVKELAKIVFSASENCMLVPAHAWTPWFSVFGSMSGFDSLEECFEEYTPQIFAIETGLSSDPPMNRSVSKLDSVALISNSDSHSARKIGREANIFEGVMDYENIRQAIKLAAPANFAMRNAAKTNLISTIEFFPEEGKYHYDGHRDCKVSWHPSQTKEYGGICSVCGRKVTVGVMSRVEDLADRKEGDKPQGTVEFKSLVPLEEIIAGSIGVGAASKAVQQQYEALIRAFGNEFEVLLNADIDQVARESSALIAEGLKRVRNKNLHIAPGFDGEFGQVEVFSDQERKEFLSKAKTEASQTSLF